METNATRNLRLIFLPIAINFFVMGFVDIIGVVTNYVKQDFNLSDSTASLMPMMVFMWFAICAVPTGILMNSIGRRHTVGLSLAITCVATIIPYVLYSYVGFLLAFVLLGIGNTVLQVSLNPLVAAVVAKEKLTSTLTMGQFVKAISSFLGPIFVGVLAANFGDWRLAFLLYGVITVFSILFLYSIYPADEQEVAQKTTSFTQLFRLLRSRYLIYCLLIVVLIVGIDVGLNVSIPNLLMQRLHIPLEEAALGSSFYFATRTIGTFLGAIVLVRMPAVRFLKITVSVAIVGFMGLFFANTLGSLLVCIAIVGLACANVFSIIFSLALQHNASYTNDTSAILIMGVSGGALIVPLQGVITDLASFTAGFAVIFGCIVGMSLLSWQLSRYHRALT